MEALYSKLYDKYTRIKTQKESEMDKLNRDQEVKFMKYITAADELIEHLRNENRRLHEQSDKLRSEAASIRSSRDGEKAEYQKLLKEEKQKNNQLSEEIDQLRYLKREGLCCSAREGNTKNGQLNMSGRLEVGSGRINDSDVSVTRKRSRHYGSSADITVAPYSGDQLEHASGRESASDLSKKSLPGGTDSVVAQPECGSASDLSKKTLSGGTGSAVGRPECCRRNIDLSGGESNVTSPTNCMFHDLIEFLVSMKLSPIPWNDGRSISAVHQSSGYSFSLTFVTSKAGEVELLYRVLSLGTFERVAPEWMKEEVLRFSTRMCPIFFQRVSRAIKCHR